MVLSYAGMPDGTEAPSSLPFVELVQAPSAALEWARGAFGFACMSLELIATLTVVLALKR